MQPILAITAAQPGVLYINGHFSGEAGEHALLRPVNAWGAVYLEYRPFAGGYCPIASKIVFSGGHPLHDGLENSENLRAVLWPEGILEIEFLPDRFAPQERLEFHAGSRAMAIERGLQESVLLCEGRRICMLPQDASIPEYLPLQNGGALLGKCQDGQYLLTLDPGFAAETGFLCAQQLEIERDERIRAISSRGDLVGHATLESWRLTPDGLYMLSSEPAWSLGAPQWPKTPEETMRAAVEAALAGLDAECEGYLAPILRDRMPLKDIQARCDLCVEMKYAPRDGRTAIGLLRFMGAALATVEPLYFRAVPSGGPQGPYQISEITFE